MCNCNSPKTTFDAGTATMPAVTPNIPVAGPIDPIGFTPDPGNPLDPFPPGFPQIPGIPELPLPVLPKFHFCKNSVPDGCWAITITPTSGRKLQGTLRVDRVAPDAGGDGLIFSGDLYTAPKPPVLAPVAASIGSTALHAIDPGSLGLPFRPRIPIYPRARYHSYLKGLRLSVPSFSLGGCAVTMDVEQFDYVHPPVGQFKGSFPASASRTLRLTVTRQADALFGRPSYSGSVLQGGVVTGSVSLTWVSKFLRRAVLEIDTVLGAVSPQPVPNASGGTDWFDTLFETAGWQLTVVRDQVNIPVPAGVVATNCWSSSALHALMQNVRGAGTNLDSEWRTHLIVVPAKITCSRGVMYDQIDVPREGSASFSDDGYPSSHSSNFGAAANQRQRDVPRAFLRSACHEVTHAFNQVHQEQETAPDNSIMTTTPSVADVLGGATTGAPGVFPDQINIGFNPTVRNHLAHMPDPVVRPGGWPFASWFGSNLQAADYEAFDASELSLHVATASPNVALGEPVDVTWTLTNNTATDLIVPNDVSLQGTFAAMEVTDSRGRVRPVRTFEIICDGVSMQPLPTGASLTSTYRVFWSTEGFAFDHPGRYDVSVAVSWAANGTLVRAGGSTAIVVDYPLTSADNDAATLVMHPEVGKWVALGGDADHLTEAVSRVRQLTDSTAGAGDGHDARDGAGRPSASRVGRMFAAIAGGAALTDAAVADAASKDSTDSGARSGTSTRRAKPEKSPARSTDRPPRRAR